MLGIVPPCRFFELLRLPEQYTCITWVFLRGNSQFLSHLAERVCHISSDWRGAQPLIALLPYLHKGLLAFGRWHRRRGNVPRSSCHNITEGLIFYDINTLGLVRKSTYLRRKSPYLSLIESRFRGALESACNTLPIVLARSSHLLSSPCIV